LGRRMVPNHAERAAAEAAEAEGKAVEQGMPT
jgi:hypothetical protein